MPACASSPGWHVEGLAVALGPFALHKDVWEVYDTLDRARREASGRRILFTVVADEQGRVLAATDPGRAPVDSAVADFADDAVPVAEVSAADGASVVRVVAPLTVQGREVGQVVTELDVSDLAGQRRATSLALLGANAAATVMLALACYLVVARMLRRWICWPATWARPPARLSPSPRRRSRDRTGFWRGCFAISTPWPAQSTPAPRPNAVLPNVRGS